MTHPSVIFFGPDDGDRKHSKIFLRTLLYSTSKKGFLIETIHIRLRRDETQQNFNVWVYGDEQLARGSGLYVSQEGISVNHHFLAPRDTDFEFRAGTYTLTVFSRIVGVSKPKLLLQTSLSITDNQAFKLSQSDSGIYFD